MTVVWSTEKDHGGYIDLHSREGEGSRFDIFLPATRDLPSQRTARFVLEEDLGSEKILVVDDVPAQREIAEKMLSRLGCDVVSVYSGESAEEYLKAHSTDLVFLDMVMPPGIDGLDT